MKVLFLVASKRSLLMTTSQEPRTTKSSSYVEDRADYLRRVRKTTELRLREVLPQTTWALLEDLPNGVATKQRVLMRCACGEEKTVRVADILSGSSPRCYRCSSREKGQPKNLIQFDGDELKYPKYTPEEDQISRIGRGAKARCTSPNKPGYRDYGGRGIEFRFPTVRAFVDCVMRTIGPRPGKEWSLDRVNNDGHYEEGNLRWATRSEQNFNQRLRQTTKAARARRLIDKCPEYTHTTLVSFMGNGLSDSEIIERHQRYVESGKHTGRPRSYDARFRYKGLRPEESVCR